MVFIVIMVHNTLTINMSDFKINLLDESLVQIQSPRPLRTGLSGNRKVIFLKRTRIARSEGSPHWHETILKWRREKLGSKDAKFYRMDQLKERFR